MADQVEVQVPDIGDFSDVEIIEVLVAPGDKVQIEDSLITVESDKASIEIPSPDAGTVKQLHVGLGDKISQGDTILLLEPGGKTPATGAQGVDEITPEPQQEPQPQSPLVKQQHSPTLPKSSKQALARRSPTAHIDHQGFKKAHASPGVRRFARELGVNLADVSGSASKGRILKGDVKDYVKHTLGTAAGGMRIPEMPDIDFGEFGEIDVQPLTRINKLTGQYLHRNWVTVPHVTQFDEADITELEAFRKSLNEEDSAKGVKITILSFLMRAAVSSLKEFPRFNASLDVSHENLVTKHYYHVGIAVDTPQGLVVPVIRDVDRKNLAELAIELRDVSTRAREGKLSPADLKGGCFTISSLGGIGGTAFTPIVNAPEVAILGVSRASMKPVYDGGEFVARLILPISLSYDHRVIDGADGARFTHYLASLLSDTRRMLL